MFIITHRKIFYIFSSLLIAASIFAFFRFGLTPSIEFTGGSLLEVEYKKTPPSVVYVKESLKPLSLKNLTIQPVGEKGFLLRFGEVSQATHEQILKRLDGGLELRFETIGPVIGQELKRKSIWALILSVVLMFLYVWVAFRKVSGRIRSWKMSSAAILALAHDVIITAGAFTFFSWYTGMEAGVTLVAALLTIWGYSINDTIVVFDRLRENVRKETKKDMHELAGEAINQTIGRSINTSLAVFILLLILYVLGPSSLHSFVMPLLVGVVIGTYSSISIATPLLLERVHREVKTA